MQMKDILNCLPLVASVLSRKYGVNVHIQGDKAYTEGKNIHIPTLPITSNEQLLCMVRGFIDHESAHIRFTDFELVKNERLDTVAFHIFNIIEDWRVENELAKLFAGSQVNLHYLIRHFFVNKPKEEKEAEEKSPASSLLNYMLLTVRSWDIAEIANPKGVLQTLRFEIEPFFHGLLDKLDILFQEIRRNCQGTQGSIYYAKKVVKLLKKYCQEMQNKEEQKQEKQKEGALNEAEENAQDSNTNDNVVEETQNISLPPVKELAELLEGKGNELPMDLGSLLAESLSQNFCSQNSEAIQIGEIDSCTVAPMSTEEKEKALSMSIALRTRIQGFLQSQVRQESAVGRRGRLYPHNLYRASVHNPKIFCRENLKKGINTAVHILLDASGSMDGERISMARQACFALGKVLSEIKGDNPAITVFPANSEDSVYPLLRHGQKLTDVTVQYGRGGTPLAPALWWTMREMFFLKENRKIIFIITDGRPDSCEATKDAVEQAEKFGFEVYGIGIKDISIKDFLPETSAVIMQLDELVSAVFAMLQKALLKA